MPRLNTIGIVSTLVLHALSIQAFSSFAKSLNALFQRLANKQSLSGVFPCQNAEHLWEKATR